MTRLRTPAALVPAVLGVLAVLVVAGCTAAGSPPPVTAAPTPSSAASASPAGAYRTEGDHRLLVVDETPVLLDTGDGTVRLLSPSGDGWDAGSALGLATPVTGHVTVGADGTLTWTRPGATPVRADRVPLTTRDLTVPVAGATLAATVTDPAAATGRSAAVVLVHEGGPRTRADVDLWARFWAATGFVVLTYDKRGEGDSTGTFPGDAPTPEVVDTLAGDVRLLIATLAAQPEVDPRRVALVGHSQAGWVAPAAARGAPVDALLLTSGSATDGAVEDAYAALTGNGDQDPGLSDAQVARQLAGVHGEYDPTAWLRALRVPSTWVYGGRDRAVPAGLAAAAVRRDAPRATVVRLAAGDHFLYDTAHGTFPEEPQATRYAPGLFPVLLAWAAARTGGSG